MDTNTERKPQIAFPGTDALVEAIREIRERTGIKLSEMGREALWEKIDDIRKNHPAYAQYRETANAN
jgi:hypothetical protein